MKLNITERISLLNILPPQGSIVTLRIVRELQSALSFTEEEMKLWKIKNRTLPDGGVNITWDSDYTNEEKDVRIGDAAKGIIVEQLKQLDSQSKLHISMLPIYEKFVEKKAVEKVVMK